MSLCILVHGVTSFFCTAYLRWKLCCSNMIVDWTTPGQSYIFTSSSHPISTWWCALSNVEDGCSNLFAQICEFLGVFSVLTCKWGFLDAGEGQIHEVRIAQNRSRLTCLHITVWNDWSTRCCRSDSSAAGQVQRGIGGPIFGFWISEPQRGSCRPLWRQDMASAVHRITAGMKKCWHLTGDIVEMRNEDFDQIQSCPPVNVKNLQQ